MPQPSTLPRAPLSELGNLISYAGRIQLRPAEDEFSTEMRSNTSLWRPWIGACRLQGTDDELEEEKQS
jgi:hypothetical protein